eukprot:PhF_6_TR1434/c0_g1_i1/m.2532
MEYLALTESAKDPKRTLNARKRLLRYYTQENNMEQVQVQTKEIERLECIVNELDADRKKKAQEVAEAALATTKVAIKSAIPNRRTVLTVLTELEHDKSITPAKVEQIITFLARQCKDRQRTVQIPRDVDYAYTREILEMCGFVPPWRRNKSGTKVEAKFKEGVLADWDADVVDAIKIFEQAIKEETLVEAVVVEEDVLAPPPLPPPPPLPSWQQEYETHWSRLPELEASKTVEPLIAHLQMLAQLVKGKDDWKREGAVYSNLGLAWKRCKEYTKAIECFQCYQTIAERGFDFTRRKAACKHIGDVYMEMGNYDEAMREYCRYLDIHDVVVEAAKGKEVAGEHGRTHLKTPSNAFFVTGQDSGVYDVERKIIEIARIRNRERHQQ